MKNQHILFVFIFFFASAFQARAQKIFHPLPFSQRVLRAELLKPLPKPQPRLSGTWIRSYEPQPEDRLVFTLKKEKEMRWGSYLQFLPDGKVAKGYSAPCGNDTNIHRHDGHYKLEYQTIFIDLGKNGTLTYRIVEQTPDSLVLEPLN